jgi:hypothetical protein
MGDQQVRCAESNLVAVRADRSMSHLTACWGFRASEVEQAQQIDRALHLRVKASEHLRDRHDPVFGEVRRDRIVESVIAGTSVAAKLLER